MPIQVHTNGSIVPNVLFQCIIRIGSSMEHTPKHIAITKTKSLQFILSFLHRTTYVKRENAIGCIAIDKRTSTARSGDNMNNNNAAISAIAQYSAYFLNAIATSITRIHEKSSTPVIVIIAIISGLTIY